jgi:hypothetical protein
LQTATGLLGGGLPGGLAGAALGLVETSLQSLAKTLRTLGNETLAADEKARRIGESIPIVGGFIAALNELGDELSGTNRSLRETARHAQMFSAVHPALSQGALRLQQAQTEADAAAHRANAFQRYAAEGPVPLPTARATAAQQVVYEQARILAPAQEQQRRAQAEVEAGRSNLGSLQAREEEIRNAQSVLDEQARRRRQEARAAGVPLGEGVPIEEAGGVLRGVAGNALAGANPDAASRAQGVLEAALGSIFQGAQAVRGAAGGANAPPQTPADFMQQALGQGQGRAERAVALQNLQETNQQQQALQQQLAANQNAQQQQILANVQNEAQARRANLDLARAQLEVARQNEERTRNAAQAMGSMNPMQRQMAVMGAQLLQQGLTPDLLPREFRENLRRVAPQHVAAAETRFGEQTPEFRQLQQMGIGINRRELRELEGERNQREATVNAQVRVDESRMAEQVARAMEPVIRIVVEQIVNQIRQIQEGVVIGQLMRQGNEG